MPEEPEIETADLQETIDEMREERKDRVREEQSTAWIRWISLSTAFLAVIAALAALQSGALVNEAMLTQLKASDHWNEYQSARQKDHLYTLQINALLDRGVLPTAAHAERPVPAGTSPAPARPHGHKRIAKAPPAVKPAEREWRRSTPGARLQSYIGEVKHQSEKEQDLSAEAKKLEEEARHDMHVHHLFAYCVTFTQVAIALSAIAALTRIRPVWYFSLIVGFIGFGMLLKGYI